MLQLRITSPVFRPLSSSHPAPPLVTPASLSSSPKLPRPVVSAKAQQFSTEIQMKAVKNHKNNAHSALRLFARSANCYHPESHFHAQFLLVACQLTFILIGYKHHPPPPIQKQLSDLIPGELGLLTICTNNCLN